MPHKPSAELDTSVRERLLAAATTLFAQKGYSATTVREIVAAAGVTKPVLYYYFQSKEGLYLELMRRTSQRFMALVEEPLAGESVAEKLLLLARRAWRVYRENQQTMKVIYSIYYGPPQGAPYVDFDAIYLAFFQTVTDLVGEGLSNGELRPGDAQLYTWALMGSVHLAMEMEMCMPQLSPGEEGLVRVIQMLLERIVGPDHQQKD